LNGTFLVDAEHRCIDRRLEIQTDDIGGFFLELGIVAGNIAAKSMRLEPSFGTGAQVSTGLGLLDQNLINNNQRGRASDLRVVSGRLIPLGVAQRSTAKR
jgi:hypothetical protein